VVLRCTKKLLALINPAGHARPAPEPSRQDWYANLLWVDRRKCLLLTHSATLFSIFEADVHAADLRAIHSLLTRLPAELIITATADRSVLGCMNDMAFLCQTTIGDSGGLACTDLVALNQALRRNINSARGYQRPIDLAAGHLTKQ
jgi:hypothetical protein